MRSKHKSRDVRRDFCVLFGASCLSVLYPFLRLSHGGRYLTLTHHRVAGVGIASRSAELETFAPSPGAAARGSIPAAPRISKRKDPCVTDLFFCLLRGPESNRRLEVMLTTTIFIAL